MEIVNFVGVDGCSVLKGETETYAITKLIENSRFWQVSGDIREW